MPAEQISLVPVLDDFFMNDLRMSLTGAAARQDRRDRLVRRQLQTAHEHAHIVHALQREQRRPLPPHPAGGASLACGTREWSEGHSQRLITA